MIELAFKKNYNCIVQYMDEKNFIIYSYDTGKFYLNNIDMLSSGLSNKVKNIQGKLYISKNDLSEIIKNAQNPRYVNYKDFTSPIVIGIMVTNECNLNCKYCIANYAHSYSQENNFHKISPILLSEIKKSGVISTMISGGEPTLYTHLSSFLSNLSNGNNLCLLDTNGVMIDDSLLKILKENNVISRISLDSIYENEHNKNRGMFSETLKNIIKLKKAGIDFRINTVINKVNIDSLPDMAEWMYLNKITKWHIFKLQSAFAPKDIWVDEQKVIDMLSYLQEKYDGKINILFKFSKNNDNFASFMVDSSGVCFSTRNKETSESEKYVFGSITNDSLHDIWKNTPMDFRLRHYDKYLMYAEKII